MKATIFWHNSLYISCDYDQSSLSLCLVQTMLLLNRWLVADNLKLTSRPNHRKNLHAFLPPDIKDWRQLAENNKLSLNCWKITVNWEKQVRKLINLLGNQVVIKQIEDSERWAKLKRSRFPRLRGVVRSQFHRSPILVIIDPVGTNSLRTLNSVLANFDTFHGEEGGHYQTFTLPLLLLSRFSMLTSFPTFGALEHPLTAQYLFLALWSTTNTRVQFFRATNHWFCMPHPYICAGSLASYSAAKF